MSTAPIIHWFRRDLRLTDNPSLIAACEASELVIPVYILSDWKERHLWTGPQRQSFLCQCLESLDNNLKHLGGRLILRQGDALEQLLKLQHETGASAIYFNKDVDPYGQAVEQKLQQATSGAVFSFDDAPLHHPGEILKGDGTPYRVYTPYSKRWLALPKKEPLARPKGLRVPKAVKSDPLPTLSTWNLPLSAGDHLVGGEKAARKRMMEALETKIPSYDQARDIPSASGTSRLSQDLRWGTLSIRELYQKASISGSLQYLKELAWRDFYFQILQHYPDVLNLEFNPDWRGLPWKQPDDLFEAWKQGRTGFPIVDAGMRELQQTGFMHNRVRMITAMFLTKDLHLDWRLGEQHFAQHLIDGEIASNNGGWQWSAGTGADAAPYFRIQNPWTQCKRFDPQGHYVRKWVRELAEVHESRFFLPPSDSQPLAPDYPPPVLDHDRERKVTLSIFKKHREQQR